MSSTNNTKLRNVLVNLDVISKLEKMDKLNTYYQNFSREKPSMLTSLSRWVRSDDQMKTCLALEELINTCISLIRNHEYDENSSVKLVRYLMASRQGLDNLRYTYSDNEITYAMLTLIIETVDDIPKMFKDIYKRVEEEYKTTTNEHDNELEEASGHEEP